MWIWTRIRNIGGNPDEEAAQREEFGGEDPGEADEKYLGGAGFGAGLAVGDAAEVAEADLEESERPRHPGP
jgi:hypothetical protein